VPVDNPRFAMAVVIDNPQAGSYYGGLVSAPVFQRVMDGSLRLMDVPPDDIETWIAAQEKNQARQAASARQTAVVADQPVDLTASLPAPLVGQ